MQTLHRIFDSIPFPILIVACLTLGLAPFVPEPHVWEKLKMLMAGELTRLVDVGDLLLHGVPWLLLEMKFILWAIKKSSLQK